MAKSIPKNIKEEVRAIVNQHNQKHQTHYQISFRSRFAYLSRIEAKPEVDLMSLLAKAMGMDIPRQKTRATHLIETKIGRLGFNTNMKDWDFAVYKYSREAYDAEDWMFPGFEEIDGTIEGALSAAPQIYP